MSAEYKKTRRKRFPCRITTSLRKTRREYGVHVLRSLATRACVSCTLHFRRMCNIVVGSCPQSCEPSTCTKKRGVCDFLAESPCLRKTRRRYLVQVLQSPANVCWCFMHLHFRRGHVQTWSWAKLLTEKHHSTGIRGGQKTEAHALSARNRQIPAQKEARMSGARAAVASKRVLALHAHLHLSEWTWSCGQLPTEKRAFNAYPWSINKRGVRDFRAESPRPRVK